MTFDEFQAFVNTNRDWFAGRLPETAETLAEAECRLGIQLPRTLKWLLSEFGYWHACGVDNLSESVETTLQCRENCGLPAQFVVLNDWGDAGVVMLDTANLDDCGEAAVYWVGYHDFQNLAEGALVSDDAQKYLSFAAYVVDRFEDNTADFESEHIKYNPAENPEGRDGSQ